MNCYIEKLIDLLTATPLLDFEAFIRSIYWLRPIPNNLRPVIHLTCYKNSKILTTTDIRDN